MSEKVLRIMRSNTKFSNGGDVTNLQVWYLNNYITIWTFFRVKLVFECDFEISWSLGPLDLWTLELLNLFPPLPSPHTFSYLFLSLPASSYTLLPDSISSYFLFLGLVWLGMVWCGLGQMTCEFIHEEISMLFHSEKFYGWWWWWWWWHCNLSYKLQVQVS